MQPMCSGQVGTLVLATGMRFAPAAAAGGQSTVTEEWDLWYPGAAATGLPFARGRLDATDVLLVHAAPPALDVAVRDAGGQLVACGRELAQTQETPIARLTMRNSDIERTDVWPEDADLGLPVILPGGEVGILVSWWHESDHSAWRWRIELFNRR
jgi:hypothetical protein